MRGKLPLPRGTNLRKTPQMPQNPGGSFLGGLAGGLTDSLKRNQAAKQQNALSEQKMQEIRNKLDTMIQIQGMRGKTSTDVANINNAGREKTAKIKNDLKTSGGINPQDKQFLAAYKAAHSEWSKYASDIMNSGKDIQAKMKDFSDNNPAYGHLLFKQDQQGLYADNEDNLNRFNSIIKPPVSQSSTPTNPQTAPVNPSAPVTIPPVNQFGNTPSFNVQGTPNGTP